MIEQNEIKTLHRIVITYRKAKSLEIFVIDDKDCEPFREITNWIEIEETPAMRRFEFDNNIYYISNSDIAHIAIYRTPVKTSDDSRT